MDRRRLRSAEGLFVALLLMVALGLRLAKVNWDDGHSAHPDERHIVMVTAVLHWPDRLVDLLDPRATTMSPFSRPGDSGGLEAMSFAYGHLPLYLLKGVTSGLQWLSRPARALFGSDAAISRTLTSMTDHLHMTLTGRVLSALFDTGTVLLVFLVGRRLFGRVAAWLSAVLLTFTVLHVQLGHFYTSETLLVFFIVLTMYWLVRLADGGGRREALWAGVAFGLALACKTTAAPMALPWLAAFALRQRRVRGDTVPLMLASAATGAAVFAIVSPYVLLDLRMFVQSIQFESNMVRGVYDLPYTRQYRQTAQYVYQVMQQLRWGMGWLPGILGFGALAWATWRLARRRSSSGEAVLVVWCLPYFLLTGSFMVKFMRYMSPLVPLLYVLAGGMVVHLLARLPRLRRLVWLAVGATVAYAVVWTFAFCSIYTRSFSRHQASLWIYRNIPTDAVITNEEWDDQLPYGVTIDGQWRSAGNYVSVSFPLQEPDGPAKVDMLVDRLTRADYIIITSNRFYGWLPRLRERFPVSSRYYELLFAGELGFDLVAEFTSYPSIGPISFVDDEADESFTVYDHPKVLIFQKTEALPESILRGLFTESLVAGQVSSSEEALLLPGPVDEYPTASVSDWASWAGDGIGAVAWWWFMVTVVGLAAWPLLYLVAGRLWAGAWPFARTFGLLAMAYVPWLLTSLGVNANSSAWFAASLLLLALVSAALTWRRRDRLLPFVRERWREVLAAEALAIVAYVAFTGIRVMNPDLWQPWWGGERPMEMGFLLATLRSGQFPPYDPFYAGGYINYYYYGLYLVSVLVKLTGVPVEVAFNLALASTYSATLAAAAGIGASLARRRPLLAAAWSALLVGVLSNLDGGLQLVRTWSALGEGAVGGELALVGWLPRLLYGVWRVVSGAAAAPAYDFWGPSRVISDTINEFPYFSFLYGDLHPHILDMAVIMLGAGVVIVLYGQAMATPAVEHLPRRFWGGVAVLAFLIGSAIVINTWDAPLLLALASGAALMAARRRGVGFLLWAAIGVVLIGAVGALLYLPFLVHYVPPSSGFGVTKSGSPLADWLSVWGLFGLLSLGHCLRVTVSGRVRRGVGGFAAMVLRHWRRLPRLLDLCDAVPHGRRASRAAWLSLGGLVLALAGLVALGRGAAAFCVLLVSAGTLATAVAEDERDRLAVALLTAAWLVLLGTELFYLKDWLAGGSAYRMNTVFKFGIQAWLLLGVGCGSLAHGLWAREVRPLDGWRGLALIGVVLAAVYPVLATPARLSNRFPLGHPEVGTLNSYAFMTEGRYYWPDETSLIELAPEHEALQWLRDNVMGTPVVAEAALGYYREGGSRVATYTGLPIPIGPQHEAEQRPEAPLGYRQAAMMSLYAGTSTIEALQIISDLDISYVYMGQLERIQYGVGGLAKFAEMEAAGDVEVAYGNEAVTIYRVLASE